MHDTLRANWDIDRGPAGEAAREVQAGPGRFGRITGGRDAMAANRDFLDQWAAKWRPIVGELADADAATSYALRHPGNDHIDAELHEYVGRRVAAELPHLASDARRGREMAQNASDAVRTYLNASGQARRDQAVHGAHTGYHRDQAKDLPRLAQQIEHLREQKEHAEQRLDDLTADPAIGVQPDSTSWIANARDRWGRDRDLAQIAAANRAAILQARAADQDAAQRMDDADRHYGPTYGHDAGRDGPSFGR